MIKSILTNSYGIFVWVSFSITLFSCFFLYLKTKKTLNKYEKEFAAEINKLSEIEKKLVIKKSKVAAQILVSQNKAI
jgi:heme exporter protein D